MFINEQREYAEEGIEWSFIEFQSNQVTLDLIELRQKGVFAMVDDECVMPQGTDTKLAGRMYAAFQSSEKFSVSSAQKVAFQFCIHHYAGKVVYSTNNFLVQSVVSHKYGVSLKRCRIRIKTRFLWRHACYARRLRMRS